MENFSLEESEQLVGNKLKIQSENHGLSAEINL
jgi:hypothetical protein